MDALSLTKENVLNILDSESLLSNCSRRKVSCFLVTQKGEIVKGHNGRIGKECREPCLRNILNIGAGTYHSVCYGIHAEVDMIKNCLSLGYDVRGAHVYSTYTPCSDCASLLAQYKINTFSYLYSYPDSTYLELFKRAGINCNCII